LAQIPTSKPVESAPKIYNPKDTIMVFLGNEFLYLDYTQDTWALGDVTTADGY